jgi:hypothetical protein
MANTCAPLIHSVRSNKPKGLRGLHHKGSGEVEVVSNGLPQMSSHRWRGGASLIQ